MEQARALVAPNARALEAQARTTPAKWRPTRPSKAHPSHWWWDFYWHRHMFTQSFNKWGPEHVTHTFLVFTGGRLEFTTVKHLDQLQQIHADATAYERILRRTMVEDLYRIETYYLYSDSVEAVFTELGISTHERLHPSSFPAGYAIHPDDVPDAAEALTEFPSQNPLSRAWELRQIQDLMIAVLDQIMDLRVDLTNELIDRIGADVVALLPGAVSKPELDATQRERGGPGDPRRIPAQTYPPLRRQPKNEADSPRMMSNEMMVKSGLYFW